MIQKDWQAVEETLDRLTDRDKLELIERLAHSLRVTGPVPSPEERREALNRLRKELAALPVRNPSDGRTNRDHDALIYGGQS